MALTDLAEELRKVEATLEAVALEGEAPAIAEAARQLTTTMDAPTTTSSESVPGSTAAGERAWPSRRPQELTSATAHAKAPAAHALPAE